MKTNEALALALTILGTVGNPIEPDGYDVFYSTTPTVGHLYFMSASSALPKTI